MSETATQAALYTFEYETAPDVWRAALYRTTDASKAAVAAGKWLTHMARHGEFKHAVRIAPAVALTTGDVETVMKEAFPDGNSYLGAHRS